MKGSSVIDYIYVIIIFLLVAIVIIGILVMVSKGFMEDLKSGKIYDKIEAFLKKVIGR
ncbi:MAG: hypothetical protein QXS37_03070 [Candidatus Aenigmatarchaeota archaeon]